MIFKITADLLVVVHFAFILFVVLGGILALKWRSVALLHIPCAVWGVLIESTGWICPLTPLEVHFREMAGETGYPGGFIDHYLIPLIYPTGLTRTMQISIAAILLVFNLSIYGYILINRSKKQQGRSG